jgi:hypothetical protein
LTFACFAYYVRNCRSNQIHSAHPKIYGEIQIDASPQRFATSRFRGLRAISDVYGCFLPQSTLATAFLGYGQNMPWTRCTTNTSLGTSPLATGCSPLDVNNMKMVPETPSHNHRYSVKVALMERGQYVLYIQAMQEPSAFRRRQCSSRYKMVSLV